MIEISYDLRHIIFQRLKLELNYLNNVTIFMLLIADVN